MSIQSYLQDFWRTIYIKFLLFTVTLAPLLFGFHLGELNAPSAVITCDKKSIRQQSISLPQCIPMSAAEFGLVQSIFTLGGLIGALAAGPVSSKRGRLFTMRINTIPVVLGPFIEALAPNVALLSIGRLLSGVGAGAGLVVVPIYISEIAPSASKGFYGSFTQIMTNCGIFITQLIGYFLSHDSMWRVILGVAGVIGIMHTCQLFFAVESPKWLAERGRRKESREALSKIRGTEDGLDEEIRSWGIDVKKIVSEGDEEPERQGLLSQSESHSAEQHESDELGYIQVVRNPNYRRAILAVILVMTAQQLTGINSIIMYGVSLLSGLLSSSSALLNILVSLLNIVATTAFAPLTDHPRLGRKGCLLVSIAGMATSSVLLGIGIRTSTKVLSAICVLTFVASFAFGLGPVPFMLPSEFVDSKGVGATQSWALAANWIATFIVAQFFPIVNEKLGKGIVYFLFCGLGAFFLASVWWYVPETRGKKGMADVWGLEEERAGHED
ncbi:Bifunctional purine biosynthesis protein PurH [Lithohypha guttulata]|uniref:Bifunctional purine biosynthesis protein PurH n=1 Tax=Lithohypha guttulata TaxID=1690604 RepID=A0AAN7T215_9EURO|nr:Bifunctional purine biosynthesis protein PurH [Lithohypha guttulata]KAK5097214.1 Bifunctional purine biosynthesis protein PurH [Lithohypha guttulata]